MHASSFSFFSSVYYVFVLFSFVVLLIFQADTSLFLFHLIVENLILHIFLIIMIIIPCSGMFRNIPCSWFYRRPECPTYAKKANWTKNELKRTLFA